VTTSSAVRRFSLIVFTAISASTLEAQRVNNVGVSASADTATPPRGRVAQRLTASAAGAVIGLFAGGYIGSQSAGNCGCDDPGLVETIYGGLAGVTLGAALGASALELRSVCSFGTRFGRSLLGAALGTVGGLFIGLGGGQVLVTVPVGAAAGSIATLGQCWNSR
jgi:hypothetical protein